MAKAAFFVLNIGGPVNQTDTNERKILVPRGAWTAIYDKDLLPRFKDNPQYQVREDKPKTDEPAPIHAGFEIPDAVAEKPHVLDYAERVDKAGDPAAAEIKIGNGTIIGIEHLLLAMEKRGYVKRTKNVITLFPGVKDEERSFKTIADLVTALTTEPGLFKPPVVEAR